MTRVMCPESQIQAREGKLISVGHAPSLLTFRKILESVLMFVRFIVAALVISGTFGCASRASSVPPVAVSSSDYRNMSCEDARALLSQKREVEDALTRSQNNAALGDAASVLLVALPLGSVFGADKEGELAIAKGEVDALERKIVTDC